MGIKSFTILIALAGAPLLAQRSTTDAAQAKPYVEATGEATVSAMPDQAVIEFGVVTQNSNAANAASENARQTDAALAEVRKLVGSGDQVKTAGYSVQPNYQSPKPGSAPVIAGYIATNTVQVTVNDLTLVGKIIDAALRSGVNNVQRLQFGLKNPQTVQSQALKQAAIRARANAEAMAEGLGVRIVRVLSAEEAGQSLPATLESFGQLTRAAPAQTEIAPGKIDVHVAVTLRAEISQ